MEINANDLINLEFNPTKIGIAILEACGYIVQTFQCSPSIYVYDNNGKLVYGTE